jgi:hypothetical protein
MISKDSFSGSKFKLFEKNKKIYIKKFYKIINKRDEGSFYKQNNFKSYYVKGYKVQSANIDIINKSKKFIILKYYSGLSGSDLILNSDLKIFKILNIFLKNYVNNLISSSKLEKFNKTPYLIKCEQIKKNILPKNFTLYKKIFKKILSNLEKQKINLKGNCHGDLTLGNLIINADYKKITLIDFLKTYNESPIQDVCKLIQDLRLYWSSRRFNKTDMLRAKIFCDNLNPFLSIKKPFLKKILDIEMSMTLLRILPYVSENDDKTLEWLDNSFDMLEDSFYRKL